MKLKLIAAMTLLVLFCACSAKEKEPSISFDTPETPSPTDVPEIEAPAEPPEIVWNLRVTERSRDATGKLYGWDSVEYYDDAGLLVSRERHFEDGSESTDYYVYDELGLLKQTYSYDWLLEEYTYDERGNLLTKTTYYEDGPVNMIYEYSYDDANCLIFELARSGEDEVYYSYEYAYDESGRLTFKYSNDGTYTAYIYDEQGNKLSEVYYDIDGVETDRTEYDYDADGNELSERHYSEDSLYLWYKSEYDENGNKIRFERLNMQGGAQDIVLCDYDDDGHLVKSTRFDASGNVVTYSEYEYEYE